MKQIYRPRVTVTVNLNYGEENVIDSNSCSIDFSFRYGTLPPSKTTSIKIEDFNQYELNKFYPLIKNSGRDIMGDYTYFMFKDVGSIRVYHNNIESIEIKEEFEEEDIDKISIERLQEDLGFRGYSELLFDRWEELKEEKERIQLAEELRRRSGIY